MDKNISQEGRTVLDIVDRYAGTWRLLLQYDENSLQAPKTLRSPTAGLELDNARWAIALMKKELLGRGEATEIFGQERGHGLAAILGAMQQSFGGQELYPSVEKKAAHLLYFVIKDHPFTDGNKRIGSFLFLLFLKLNGMMEGIDSKTLVALALLTAASDPKQKELMIRLIMNLLAEAGR